jgi:hypothetical protein
MRSGWLVVILIAGCGGGGGHPDGYRGGSRLEARYLVADSGARAFQTFHDTELDADCWFQVDASDDPRCVPSIEYSGIYSDDACTIAVLADYDVGDTCDYVGAFVGVYAAEGCGGWDKIWRVGDRLAASAPLHALDGTGACVVVPRDPSYAYYGVGDELTRDAFVGARFENTGEGRLRSRVLVGDDGSRMPYGIWDAELDGECWLMGDPAHCVPVFNYGSYNTDDACTVPVLGRSGECEDPMSAYIGAFRRADACGFEMTLYENAGPTTPTTLYYGFSTDSCAPATIDEDAYFATGDEVDQTQFPAAVRELGDEDGRIQAYWRTGDGYRASTWGFHDRDLDIDCSVTEIGPDEFRCLPDNLPGTVTFYTTDQCTETTTLAEFYERGACGDPSAPAPTRVMDWTYDGCRGDATMYEIGAEVASGTPYSLDTGICAPTTWDTAVVHRYRLGAEISLDDYAIFRPGTD